MQQYLLNLIKLFEVKGYCSWGCPNSQFLMWYFPSHWDWSSFCTALLSNQFSMKRKTNQQLSGIWSSYLQSVARLQLNYAGKRDNFKWMFCSHQVFDAWGGCLVQLIYGRLYVLLHHYVASSWAFNLQQMLSLITQVVVREMW